MLINSTDRLMVLGVKFHLIASSVDALTPTTSIKVWIVDYPLTPFSRKSGHKKIMTNLADPPGRFLSFVLWL